MGKNRLEKREIKTLDSPIVFIICGVFAAFLYISCFTGIVSNNFLRYMVQITLFITIGEMWNLMSGFAGMTSLGQQLYIGLSGYCVAVMTSMFNMPLAVGLAAGMILSVVVSFLLSFILFRMEGMFFAIASWVVAEIFMMIFLSWEFVGQGGGLTIKLTPYPRVQDIFLISLTLCIAAIAVVYLLLRSKVGLGLTAMRDNISAAASVGINVRRYKLLVYIIASAFIGLVGGIFFINKGTIYPDSGFSISFTISMVFITIIGGSGTVSGPIVGAVIYVFLEEFLAHYPGWSNITLGIITILVVLFLPSGIMGTIRKKFRIELFSSKRFPPGSNRKKSGESDSE